MKWLKAVALHILTFRLDSGAQSTPMKCHNLRLPYRRRPFPCHNRHGIYGCKNVVLHHCRCLGNIQCLRRLVCNRHTPEIVKRNNDIEMWKLRKIIILKDYQCLCPFAFGTNESWSDSRDPLCRNVHFLRHYRTKKNTIMMCGDGFQFYERSQRPFTFVVSAANFTFFWEFGTGAFTFLRHLAKFSTLMRTCDEKILRNTPNKMIYEFTFLYIDTYMKKIYSISSIVYTCELTKSD